MAILSIGIFAVFSMQLRSTQGNTKANRLTEASSWNVDQIEQIIGTQYANITNGTATSNDGRYTISWTVSADNPMVNVKTITVNVQDNQGALSNPISYTYIKADI